MRRVVLLLSTMSLTLLLLSGVALAQPAPRQVPDASCQLSGPSSLEAFFRSSAIAAQTFKAEHTGFLTSAQVQVKDVDTKPPPLLWRYGPWTLRARLPNWCWLPPQYQQPMYQTGSSEKRQPATSAPVHESKPESSTLSSCVHPRGGGRLERQQRNPCPGAYSSTYEGRPEFQSSSPDLDVFFSTFVRPGATTRSTTRARSAQDGAIRDDPPRWGTTQHRWPSHPRPGCRCAGVARQRVGYRAVVCAAASSTLYGREAHAHLIAWIVLLRVLFHEWNRIAGIGDESCVNAPP